MPERKPLPRKADLHPENRPLSGPCLAPMHESSDPVAESQTAHASEILIAPFTDSSRRAARATRFGRASVEHPDFSEIVLKSPNWGKP